MGVFGKLGRRDEICFAQSQGHGVQSGTISAHQTRYLGARNNFCLFPSQNCASTASFKNVPPCTTIRSPIHRPSWRVLPLYKAFFTTLIESPRGYIRYARSVLLACLTDLIHKDSAGGPDGLPALLPLGKSGESSALYPMDFAKVSIKEPQPDEQAH